ncbi:MAG: aldehyde dehydrogenase family protein [Candidatus Diapherotrites archaeon]|nr:aldehyde dehydrogenase family protein [Candidatus Diapherotrites archaeon]
MRLKFENLIGGSSISLTKAYFPIQSFYDPGFVIEVPNAGVLDAKTAISKARSSTATLAQMPFEERSNILYEASRKIKFTDDEIESWVKLSGMPITAVKDQLNEVEKIFKIIPDLIRKRIGINNGKIGRNPIEGHPMFKYMHPISGYVYVVTPGNDPRVTSFVAAWLISLGLPGIFKPSKTDFPIASKTIQTLIQCGYPKEALHVVNWDTNNQSKGKIHFDLVDSSSAIWAFGDNGVVENLLRWEINGDHKVDHFSDKIVLKHTTGRTASICASSADIRKTVDLAVESSLTWPIGCNALKSIFDASGKNSELMPLLIEKFESYGKWVGDPMNKKTKVGNVNPEILSMVGKRCNELSSLNQLQKFSGDFLSESQSSPLLFKTNDIFSEFLSTEFSCYLLTVKQSENYSSAVNELNMSAGKNHRLVTVVYTEDESEVLKEYLHAHHIKRMKHSTELDIMFHEGNDYLHQLTRPQIHH